jgi:hypothetical protein
LNRQQQNTSTRSDSDQGVVNNLHSCKKFLLNNEEQIIDRSRERGRRYAKT